MRRSELEDLLAQIADGDDRLVAKAATESLVEMGKSAVPVLTETLARGETQER